jgi:hypothetical protein
LSAERKIAKPGEVVGNLAEHAVPTRNNLSLENIEVQTGLNVQWQRDRLQIIIKENGLPLRTLAQARVGESRRNKSNADDSGEESGNGSQFHAGFHKGKGFVNFSLGLVRP